MSGIDAERYEERNPLAPGKPVPRGFQDPSATYPSIDRQGQTDASPEATGTSEILLPNLNTRAARVSSTVAQTQAQTVGRSRSGRSPRYPRNKVERTASGLSLIHI